MELCDICGVTEVQTDITECNVSGNHICPLCCLLSRRDKLLQGCLGCNFVPVGEISA